MRNVIPRNRKFKKTVFKHTTLGLCDSVTLTIFQFWFDLIWFTGLIETNFDLIFRFGSVLYIKFVMESKSWRTNRHTESIPLITSLFHLFLVVKQTRQMATSLPLLNVIGNSLPSSSRLFRRRSYIVSRQDLPEFSAKSTSSRLSFSPASLSQFRNGTDRFLSPESSSPIRSVTVSSLSTPLISPNDEWGTWTALFATGALGLWYDHHSL